MSDHWHDFDINKHINNILHNEKAAEELSKTVEDKVTLREVRGITDTVIPNSLSKPEKPEKKPGKSGKDTTILNMSTETLKKETQIKAPPSFMKPGYIVINTPGTGKFKGTYKTLDVPGIYKIKYTLKGTGKTAGTFERTVGARIIGYRRNPEPWRDPG